jgi:histidyl-tRNA synthetase
MERQIQKPTPISGFPEWLPAEKLVEQRFLDKIRATYEAYGFTPIETAAAERAEVLSAKGGLEKEIYALSRLAAGEGEEAETGLALHFDLTVPTARYVAQNYGHLTFPFRRYQIQKVWRGERPQAGRFREFYQADIDVIGDGQLSIVTDAEIPAIIYDLFRELAIGDFVIRISNRKILSGYLAHLGCADAAVNGVLGTIDKIEKIGPEKVTRELEASGALAAPALDKLMALIATKRSNEELISHLYSVSGNERFTLGVDELAEVVEAVAALGVPESHLEIDLTIVRGLDYYTGTIYETRLVDHPEIGSICSGGRYDDLASHFIDKPLPGVGISIGLTRLLASLFKAGLVTATAQSPAPVLVTTLERERTADYLKLARYLREGGIKTEVFLEPKKLGQQLKYAD